MQLPRHTYKETGCSLQSQRKQQAHVGEVTQSTEWQEVEAMYMYEVSDTLALFIQKSSEITSISPQNGNIAKVSHTQNIATLWYIFSTLRTCILHPDMHF